MDYRDWMNCQNTDCNGQKLEDYEGAFKQCPKCSVNRVLMNRDGVKIDEFYFGSLRIVSKRNVHEFFYMRDDDGDDIFLFNVQGDFSIEDMDKARKLPLL